jgi:hypothetical protein
MRSLRHPIAAFVLAVLVVIGVGVGGLAATGSGLPVGTVTGRFVEMGGPYPGLSIPLSGHVVFSSARGANYSTSSDAHGQWALSVPPGTYAVTGFSPKWDDGRAPCRAGNRVRVRAGAVVNRVEIVCPVV